MAKKLAAHLESAAIIPFYAEYMDIARTSTTGFPMEGVFLVYDPCTSDGRNGRITKQVRKSASSNIHICFEAADRENMRERACARGEIPREHLL